MSGHLPDSSSATGSSGVVGGRYRLGPLLGRGRAAEVREAMDTRLGRRVAVKLFVPHLGHGSEQRFAQEALLLARLDHPGLVTVYDVGVHEGRAYLVMRLIEGPTLRRLLSAGPLPARRVARIGAGLARALAHVHASGIVHRDVKPSNVLLSGSGTPYLTDFGIARPVDATHHTAPDVLLGTAAYVAPEQALGKEVGAAADVYALGLVLLECLTGRLEYEGTALEAALARLHRQPEIPGWVPGPLARLLGGMTALQEAARPDAAECARVLADIASDPAVHPAGPPATAPLTAPLTAPAAGAGQGAEYAAESGAVRWSAGTRVSRRLAVGTALAALSAALGAAVAVAPHAGGDSGTRAAAGAHTPATTPAPARSGSPAARRPPAASSATTATGTPSTSSAHPAGPAGGRAGGRAGRTARVREAAGDVTRSAAERGDGDRRQPRAHGGKGARPNPHAAARATAHGPGKGPR
ncbi:protein kinase domain-containing protein [Streptomyces sp. NPDC003374]